MLQAINKGLVLNAIVEAGFKSTYNHFDIVRFCESGNTNGPLGLDVTCGLPFNQPAEAALAQAVRARGITPQVENDLQELRRRLPTLARLAERLVMLGCVLKLPDLRQFPEGKFACGAVALMERTDIVPFATAHAIRFTHVNIRIYH